MRTLREGGAHLDIDTYLHFVVLHVCLRRPSSDESYHVYVCTDVNYDSICLSRLLVPSVSSSLANCLYYTSLSLRDISSHDCSQADCKFAWYQHYCDVSLYSSVSTLLKKKLHYSQFYLWYFFQTAINRNINFTFIQDISQKLFASFRELWKDNFSVMKILYIFFSHHLNFPC